MGCGTGEHARVLSNEHGYRVDGLDIDDDFLGAARSRLPEARFWQGDMADFSLDVLFDGVLWLFGAIGYVRSVSRLESTLRCFRSHLKPGGVAIVEPWFEPTTSFPGRVHRQTVDSGDVQVVRMSYSGLREGVSVLNFHFLIGTPAGVEYRNDELQLGLFTREEMERSFELEYESEGLAGRALYLARAAASTG